MISELSAETSAKFVKGDVLASRGLATWVLVATWAGGWGGWESGGDWFPQQRSPRAPTACLVATLCAAQLLRQTPSPSGLVEIETIDQGQQSSRQTCVRPDAASNNAKQFKRRRLRAPASC